MRSGIHWTNDPEHWLSEQSFRTFARGNFSAVLLLSLHPPALFQRIAQARPDILILCRLYWPQGAPPTPAEALARWAPFMESVSQWCQHFQVLNEVDLEYSLAPSAAREVLEGLKRALKEACPWALLGFPGASVRGPQSVAWLAATMAEARSWDWYAEHCYANVPGALLADETWGQRYRLIQRAAPGLPLHLTEYGFKTGSGHPLTMSREEKARLYVEYLLTLAGVESAALYIMEPWQEIGDTDGELQVSEEMAALLGAYQPAVREESPSVIEVSGSGRRRAAEAVFALRSSTIDARAELPDRRTADSPAETPWPQRSLQAIDELSIHHTVTPGQETTEEEERTTLQSIHTFHTGPARRWPGIGYWYLIFPSGRLYQVGSLSDQRASVSGQNHHLIGCALVGDFTEREPSEAQITAARRLRRHLEKTLNRPLVVRPHRHYGGTACPGETWSSWLPRIAEEERPDLSPGQGGLPEEAQTMLLAYIDTAWGKTLATEQASESPIVHRLQGEIRDYLLLIKQELGL